jgi:hypothetical protein
MPTASANHSEYFTGQIFTPEISLPLNGKIFFLGQESFWIRRHKLYSPDNQLKGSILSRGYAVEENVVEKGRESAEML